MSPGILKYKLDRNVMEQSIELGENAAVLSVGEQYNEPYIWVLVHPLDAPKRHRFIILTTGDPIPHSGLPQCFLGTVIMDGGDYVIHVFCDDMWQRPSPEYRR